LPWKELGFVNNIGSFSCKKLGFENEVGKKFVHHGRRN